MQNQTNRERGFLTSLWIIAGGLSALLLLSHPFVAIAWPLAILLFSLALLCELAPVHYHREGVMLALSLAYVCGFLVISGPTNALVAELLLVITTAVIQQTRKRSSRALYWLKYNAAVTVISSATGGLLWTGADMLGSHWAVGVTVFVAGYLGINYLLVTHIGTRFGAHSFSEQIQKGLRFTLFASGIYLLFGIGIGVLVRENLALLLPLTYLPIWLLRSVIDAERRLEEVSYETMVALTIMLQRAHPYTHGHLERVGNLAEDVGRKLGLPRSKSRLLREAAVLHDIGKIAIDEEVLDKPARLTESEFEHVKQHSEFGARILSGSERFQAIVPWVRHHHERPDGKGYPHQLSDIEIPIESKIISVADAFDAMVGGPESSEKRSYRDPMTEDDAIAELERCSGTQFDPRVVQAFKDCLRGASR